MGLGFFRAGGNRTATREVPRRHPELQQASYRGKIRTKDVDLRAFGRTFNVTKVVK